MEKKMENLNVYQLPDLQFLRWCEEYYQVNRGVYNIIDQKLYEMGFEFIVPRRKALINFLELNITRSQTQKYYKFGPGKLSDALSQFQLTIK